MWTDQDGRLLLAADEAELVSRLHDGSRAPAASDQEWMREVAQRMKLYNGASIRTDTAEHFIADLEAQGVIAEQRRQ